jgi:hypothetical protein
LLHTHQRRVVLDDGKLLQSVGNGYERHGASSVVRDCVAVVAGVLLLAGMAGAAGYLIGDQNGRMAPRPPSTLGDFILNAHPTPPPVPVAIAPPTPPSSLHSSILDAMTAAGVGMDQANTVADQVDAAMSRKIAADTADLRWYGKAAVAGMVPLWIFALVALFRHQRESANLRELQYLVDTARDLESSRRWSVVASNEH